MVVALQAAAAEANERGAPVHARPHARVHAPTQVLTHGQWWSILMTQRPQTLQWCARAGLKWLHLQCVGRGGGWRGGSQRAVEWMPSAVLLADADAA